MLRARVAHAPAHPGVYRWLDKDGITLYVGKAKNLRNRLRSYVVSSVAAIGPWRQSFYQQIADFDVTVTASELEALILETNLIKQLRPKYNVLMKDDKNYLYICVHTEEPYPRVEVVRRLPAVHGVKPLRDHVARCFGPYLSSYQVQEILDFLNEIYGFRACEASIEVHNRYAEKGDPVPADRLRPCLESQIGRCNGLCGGLIKQEEYRARIGHLTQFLKGDEDDVKKRLFERMQQAAAEKRFEKAAEYRNRLRLLEKTEEQDTLVSDTSGEDCDVIGVALLSGRAHVVVMVRRRGKVIGEQNVALSGQAEDASQVLEEFLPQYYSEVNDIPPDVIVSAEVPDSDVMMEWLSAERGAKVRLIVPERGKKSQLLRMAERNAYEKALHQEAKWEAEARNIQSALAEIATTLSLSKPPDRIEGYDISHLGGTETVGSMVVTLKGKPARDHYRSFTLRSIGEGEVDDYKALKEVLTRRFRRFVEDLPAEEEAWKQHGIRFGKARKAEQTVLQELIAKYPERLTQIDVDYHEYIVARREENIIGFIRLYKHPGLDLKELKSLWVVEEERGGKLGQFLIRKLLRSVKKGKVYVTIDPHLEEYYAQVGFRYVIKPPKVLQDHELCCVMVWDASQNKIDPSFSSRPDLLVIDGGKGQLNAALEVLRDMVLDIPVIGLAKREEEIFVPGQKDHVSFAKDSPAKFLLMRLRDEAHRFANRLREGKGLKRASFSQLDEIPGLGPRLKQKLLQKFGSLSAIKSAQDAELRLMLNETQLKKLRENLS